LNEQREKNKQEKIKAFNKITVEENALIKELKKAGFKHAILEEKKEEDEKDNEYNELLDNVDNINEPDDNNDNNDILIDNAGGKRRDINDENKLMSYDREDDDENMDTEEMGFIYN
jgi:hypothetical protein